MSEVKPLAYRVIDVDGRVIAESVNEHYARDVIGEWKWAGSRMEPIYSADDFTAERTAKEAALAELHDTEQENEFLSRDMGALRTRAESAEAELRKVREALRDCREAVNWASNTAYSEFSDYKRSEQYEALEDRIDGLLGGVEP